MNITTKVDSQPILVELAQFRAALADRAPLLKILGEKMVKSITYTFAGEGSPAGSWPRLAISTLRKKEYTTGHKLLVLSGTLRRSIGYVVSGNTVTIGSRGLKYAAVQNFGSADRAGSSFGPQARIAGRSVHVGPYSRLREVHYGTREGETEDGRTYRVPVAMRSGKHEIIDARGRRRIVSGKYEGPRRKALVGEHERFQNIPARPFAVFRPEDPARLVSAAESYFAGKAGSLAGGVA